MSWSGFILAVSAYCGRLFELFDKKIQLRWILGYFVQFMYKVYIEIKTESVPLPQLIDFSPCLRGQLISSATAGSGTAPGCMEIGRPSQELGPKGPRKGAKPVEEEGQSSAC